MSLSVAMCSNVQLWVQAMWIRVTVCSYGWLCVAMCGKMWLSAGQGARGVGTGVAMCSHV